MKKETTNKIRFVLEDIMPAILRDSFIFHGLVRNFWDKSVTDVAEFRENIVTVTDEAYEKLYQSRPNLHDHGDNTQACIDEINRNIVGKTVCDVGCGTGSLLLAIQDSHPKLDRLVGVDFAFDSPSKFQNIEFVKSKIENLPFEDNEFDTVVCTHVVEHILEYKKAIAELRRIAKLKLIIVTPREREYKYTFNAHLNFFPYTHSLLRAMYPVPEKFKCIDIKRDLYYHEVIEP